MTGGFGTAGQSDGAFTAAMSRGWAERVYLTLIHWNELDRGGHFAKYKQPALFTRELRDCFRSVR